MASEEFTIIGILNEFSAVGQIKTEDLKSLICDHLQVTPYYAIILQVLGEQRQAHSEKAKIDIHQIFDAMKSSHFINNIPPYYNNRITKYSIKLIRAALVTYSRGLLTMKEIKDAANVHQMKEFQSLSLGIPYDAKEIQSALWMMGRAMSNEILNKWLKVNADMVETKGSLMVHEFVYLVCNSLDKQEIINKIPKPQMNPKMDKKTGLFRVDDEFHKTYKNPDFKIQTIMTNHYNMEKAAYDGITKDSKVLQVVRKQKKSMHREEQTDEREELRKKLRNEELIIDIKLRLKETYHLLRKSRINGKTAYFEQKNDDMEELPHPISSNTQREQKENAKQFKYSQPKVTERPKTAVSHKTLPGLISPKSTATGFHTLKQSTMDMSHRSPIKVFSTMTPSNREMESMSRLPENEHRGNFDFLTSLDYMIEEEYDQFNQKNLVEEEHQRKKTPRYFNSGLEGRTLTRIQSAAPRMMHKSAQINRIAPPRSAAL
jgi:hypothetical protein